MDTTTPKLLLPPSRHVDPLTIPAPPPVREWVSLADPGRALPGILYTVSQCMVGRGRLGLLHGQDGLVYYFTPDALDRQQREYLDDISEIWVVTRMERDQ